MSNKLKVGDIVEHVHDGNASECYRHGSIAVVVAIDDETPFPIKIEWLFQTKAHADKAAKERTFRYTSKELRCMAHAD